MNIPRKQPEILTKIPESLMKQITSKDWYRHGVYRDTFVFTSEVSRGLKKTFFQLEGIEKGLDNYLQLGAEVFVSQTEFNEFVTLYRKKLEDPNYLPAYIQQYEYDLQKAIDHAKLIGVRKTDLGKNYTRLWDGIAHLHHWLWSMEFLNEAFDSYLREKISEWKPTWDDQEIADFITKISYIEKKLAFQEEKSRILKLKTLSDDEFKVIYEQYKWLNMHLFDGEPFTIQEYNARAKKYIDEEEKHIKDIDEKRKLAIEAIAIIERIDNHELQKTLKLAQQLIYLKTYRLEVYTLCAYYSLPLRKAIATQLKITLAELNKLTVIEVARVLERGNLNREAIALRDTYGFVKVDDIQYICSSPLVPTVKEFIWKEITDQKVLKGTVAYKGLIKGIARVILNDNDIPNVKKGEILVCNLTNPDYNPVFDKIIGLVTDEGGVLCHSAIMAREFKIPCIIGTKIATKTIQTGDMIELNANTGVIKKL